VLCTQLVSDLSQGRWNDEEEGGGPSVPPPGGGGGVGAGRRTYLALEFVDKVVDETVVKVLTTQVGVTGSGLDLEDTLFDGEKRNV
jgi:hypothetical protein